MTNDQFRPRDMSLIDIDHDEERRYWIKEFGCTEDDLRAAVRDTGSGVEAVRKALKGVPHLTSFGE